AQAMAVQVKFTDDLRIEQRHRVGRDRIAKSGMKFLGHCGAADHAAPLEHRHLEARRRQVRRAHQAVVTGADDHGIAQSLCVRQVCPLSLSISGRVCAVRTDRHTDRVDFATRGGSGFVARAHGYSRRTTFDCHRGLDALARSIGARVMRPPRHYSAWSLLRARLAGNGHWRALWTGQKLKGAYEVIVVGAGGHGLATAFHLARDHGFGRIAVLEKRLLGLGNVGRNTTIVRSNYLYPENHYFYEDSLRRYERLSRDLNYNVMYSPRGVVDLALSDDDFPGLARRGNAMRLAGIDAELMDAAALERFCPELGVRRPRRFPIVGALVQRRGGTVRHDAVAWGYARAAAALGVDIIED